MTRTTAAIRTFFIVALIAVAPAGAQWRSDLAIYGWGSGIDGTVGAGDVETEINMSFSDILDDLQFGFMGGYSGSNGRWAFQADAVIANLGTTVRGDLGVVRADIDTDLTILEGDLGFEADEDLRLFVGARYVDLSNEIELRVANQVIRAKGSESWVDPVVGFRWGFRYGNRLQTWFRGDVGGFGVGSDLSWNGVVAVAYSVNDRVSVGLGYRVLDIDFEDGKGADRFRYDTQMSGVVSGVVLSW